MTDIDCVVDTPSLLGECPVWSPAEQVLYWADIEGTALHRYDPATGVDEVRAVPGRPGSFALTGTAGRLLVGLELQLVWFDWPTGQIEPWVDLEAPGSGNRLNDGKCDGAGRFVVGTMWPRSADEKASGSLYVVTGDGRATTMAEGIGVPNGLAFDPERDRMYFADTRTETVEVWDYDTASGQRSNRRVFLDYRDLPGKPDGACLDADGCYWSASVYGWSVIRVTPDGAVDRRIELPLQKPSMPAFGGADLSTLYVTTIGAGGSQPAEPPRSTITPGSLLALDPGVQGRPETPFASPAR